MKPSVLIADDHDLLRRGVCDFLRETGCFAVSAEASSGGECVDLAKLHRPDLVVMDVSMPDMNGYEATKLIVAELSQTKIVALSAYNNSVFVRRMLRAGACAYVSKDDGWRELRRALVAVMDGRQYLSPSVNRDGRRRERGKAATYDQVRASGLTRRQLDVLRLLARGEPTKCKAQQLGITYRTADWHIQQLKKRTGLHTRAELACFAAGLGIASLA